MNQNLARKYVFFRAVFFFMAYTCAPSLNAQVEFPSEDFYMKSIRQAGDSILNAKTSITPQEIAFDLTSKKALSILPSTVEEEFATNNALYTNTKPGVLVIGMGYRAPSDTSIRVNLASGYAISPDGICVTNYHVVATYASTSRADRTCAFWVRNGAGEFFAIKEVLKVSKEDDLAILQLDLGSKNSSIPYLSLSPDDAKIGDPIFVLATPQNLFYFFTAGIVSGKYQRRSVNDGENINRNTLAITAEYAVGSSGGPILNKKGEVVGTVSSTQAISSDGFGRNVQMVVKNAIPVSSLHNLL